MPCNTLHINDGPTQDALSRGQMATGPHARGGAANNAANHSNEGMDAFIGNLSSSTPNSNTIALDTSTDSDPLSSQTPRPLQTSLPQRQTTTVAPPHDQIRDKLDLSPENKEISRDFLQEAFFPDWKDDAASADLGNPDEMQKKDPLASQIWKFYTKTKTQLPQQERMENLSWRLMAMNLKRKEREQARYV